MNQKRVIVLSTTQNAASLTKCKSAQANPLTQDVYRHSLNKHSKNDVTKSGRLQALMRGQQEKSDLLSEEPQYMINQAYYTYLDPSYDADRNSNKQDQNDQYFIQSMHKKKEMQEQHKKYEQKQKLLEKQAKQVTASFKQKRQFRHKQAEKKRINKPNKSISSPQNICVKMYHQKKLQNKCKRPSNQKDQFQNENVQVIKKQLNSQRLKPRPLDFDVDMLEKLPMKPGKSKKKEQILTNFKFAFKSALDQTVTITNGFEKDYDGQLTNGENRNCRKLPFRFLGVT